jgi:hypothetical protein
MRRLLDLWRWRQHRPGIRRPRSLVRPAAPPVPRSPADTTSQAARTPQPGSHRRVSKYRLLRGARVREARDPGNGGHGSNSQDSDALGRAEIHSAVSASGWLSRPWQPSWPDADPRPSAAPQPAMWSWPANTPEPGQSRWPGAAAMPGETLWPGATSAHGLPAHAPARAAIRTQPRKAGRGTATGAGATRARIKSQPAAREKAAAGQKTAAAHKAAARETAAAREKPAAPWFERARRSHSAPGQRHCGLLEKILHRQWQADELPPAQIVLAVDRLAQFPQLIKERLVAGLDAIYLGPGGVPDLDDMSSLSGMPLPSGRATWDACAGAYGDRKVIVGSRPSPTPDVLCHEIGHALDDIDGMEGTWQSDSHEFSTLYGQCRPWMTTDFHRQSGPMGRREFFADAFAAIASSQRPALVEMLGGNTRVALSVMLYFNVRYGI